MAPRKPPDDDLPETIGGWPLDQWLSFRCFNYLSAELYGSAETTRAPPDAEFVRLLMRFHHKHHPPRELSREEIAARVDFVALSQPTLWKAVAQVARFEAITENEVKYAHRKYGRPGAELARERKARRVKWAAADESEWIAEKLVEQTIPTKIPGRPKGRKNEPRGK